MILGVIVGWCAASIPVALVLGPMLRARDRADVAFRVERDELVRTIIATASDGPTAARLRATRPELGEAPSMREMLRRQADASAAALHAMDDSLDAPKRNGNSMIPVGMGGE